MHLARQSARFSGAFQVVSREQDLLFDASMAFSVEAGPEYMNPRNQPVGSTIDFVLFSY
jgi:hypothetical protein